MRMRIYVDASVVGGCEDVEFSEDSKSLWREFIAGNHVLLLSAHTLRELEGAPSAVRDRLLEVPPAHQIVLGDSDQAVELAEAYLAHGAVGRGSRADAMRFTSL